MSFHYGITVLLVLHVTLASTQSADRCNLPLSPGSCSGNFMKWGFRQGQCVQFIYGGCGGNENKFETQDQCENTCSSAVGNRCELPLETGLCKASIPRWGQKGGKCVEFIYGGCGGNANNFETKEQCEAACPKIDKCKLPIEPGTCPGDLARWGAMGSVCVKFLYGGCDGNDNRFWTPEDCEEECLYQHTAADCEWPITRGPCIRGHEIRWGWRDGKCVQFVYGGCLGNRNNFKTKELCEATCPITNGGPLEGSGEVMEDGSGAVLEEGARRGSVAARVMSELQESQESEVAVDGTFPTLTVVSAGVVILVLTVVAAVKMSVRGRTKKIPRAQKDVPETPMSSAV